MPPKSSDVAPASRTAHASVGAEIGSDAAQASTVVKVEAVKTWTKWFQSTLNEGQVVNTEVMKEAARLLVDAGLLSVQDSVGLESADLADLTGWSAGTMAARALVKGSVAVANEVHGGAMLKRPIATPMRQQSAHTRIEQAVQ